MFHPFELAFCGLSGSGKTTLVTRLLRHFRQQERKPGYFKHGCHRFDIDRTGKDSYLARQAGAVSVMIADPEKEALISDTPGNISGSTVLDSCDILFIEGLKELPIPKILVVDTTHAILPLLEKSVIGNVLALVHDGHAVGLERFGLPCFHRDDIGAIAEFVGKHLTSLVSAIPLYGLVVAGGRSLRMGSDKALLTYGKDNQLAVTASLLSEFCPQVFVSCRQDQAAAYAGFGHPVLTDTYLDLGPLGGLLSAQREHPEAAWFVVACDFPYLDGKTLGSLSSSRDPFRFATAFMLPGADRPEPLCTIYEPKSRISLLRRHGNGNDSLSSFLAHSRISIVNASGTDTLRNVNDPSGMQRALEELNGEQS